jgi:polyphosphate kinase
MAVSDQMNNKKTKKTSKKKTESETLLDPSPDFVLRDLSWLSFNNRVLNEAKDDRNPLLERLRFLTIFYSNLDEFFMKRVGNLKRHVSLGISLRNREGLPWDQMLKDVRDKVSVLVRDAHDVFEKDIRRQLKNHGIEFLKWEELKEEERVDLHSYFRRQVFPVLTPLSVDPGHPFPFISNLSTSLGVALCYPERDEKFFARVKIPRVLPQWVKTNGDGHRFISLLDLVRANINDLFPAMQILSVMPFRVTRDVEVERDEEDVDDILEMIEEELKQRRFAAIVRVEFLKPGDPWILKFLLEELETTEADFYEGSMPLDYLNFQPVVDLNLTHLKFDPWVPRIPSAFLDESTSIFTLLKNHDYLVHSPYESFGATVERMVGEAATDPKVLAIKMTLYRTGDNSPFVKALIRAAESGKQVICLVELKARFDEERNIFWAQELEKSGVHVVYGIVGLKTHAKTTLIVRQEPEGLKSYCHIGTGNYNAATARLYTDLGYMTSKESITSEIIELFNYLTGRSLRTQYAKLLVAPINMYQRFQEMIEREKNFAAHGKPSHIIAKCNSLEERQISRSLYRASQGGVKIDLIVRGFCCLRPQVPGLSENIRVISVIGRFLEHSRIYYFRAGAADPVDGEFYIGSADWMHRNLHARVEAILPIEDRLLKEKCWEILQVMLSDQRQAWDMKPSGEFIQRTGASQGTHSVLMNQTKARYGQHIEEPKIESDENKS